MLFTESLDSPPIRNTGSGKAETYYESDPKSAGMNRSHRAAHRPSRERCQPGCERGCPSLLFTLWSHIPRDSCRMRLKRFVKG